MAARRTLAAREGGADLVNIAQIFQRSGTLMVSFKEKNITKVEDFKGKNVGSWLLGNEAELFAAMRKVGLDPEKDANIIKQNFDMSQLLNGEVDVAQAMIYNEYAQVLETRNPKTGELYKPEDLNVIDFNEVGTAMLQDGIMARESWLSQPGNEDIAVRFLRATFRGWIFCRDNFDECVQIVLNNGTALGESHMRWQLNEVNALIWPRQTASASWTRTSTSKPSRSPRLTASSSAIPTPAPTAPTSPRRRSRALRATPKA